MIYSLKRVRFEPERANTSENKEKRKLFVQELLAHQSRNVPLLYVDKTNLNIHISRSVGRSLIGRRCTVVASGSNVYKIGCIGSLGLTHHEIKRGSFRREEAMQWMHICLRNAYSFHKRPVVVVLDSARCHSRIEEILLEDHKFLRLAPYSSIFNPIEHVWSVVKADVKRNMAENMSDMLNDELRGSLTVTEYRLQFLERFISIGKNFIVPDLCCSCVAHIQEKVPGELALKDMEF